MKHQNKYFTNKELVQAYLSWSRNYEFGEFEETLKPYLNFAIKKAEFPIHHFQGGWLRQARKAAFMSAEAAASKCQITRASFVRYEDREMDGNITLANLAKAAEAIDCELIYAIRPKTRILFSEQIFKTLIKSVEGHVWLTKCDQRRRAGALAGLARKKMLEPEFKREQGWSQKNNRLR